MQSKPKPLEIQREVKTPVVDPPPAAVGNEETLPMAKPADIFSLINLPKVEFDKFDGDPMKYQLCERYHQTDKAAAIYVWQGA